MTSKKIISAIMAGACALSMTSIAAFAADPATTDIDAAGEKTYDVEAGYTAPVIDVTVPTAIKAVINPYQIAIEVETGVNTNTTGIASPEYSIKNNSTTFGIKVGAKLTAKGTGIAVVDAPEKIPTKIDSEKTAFAFLNTATAAGGYANADYVAAEDGKTQLKFTEDVPDRATVIMTLDKDGGTDPNEGFFQVQGKVTDPEVVEKKYATTDKLALSIVFDINPFNPAAGGGVNPPVATARVTGATATAQGTAIAAGNIVVNSTAKTITITSGASVGNTIAVTLTLDTGNTLGTVTATDGSKFASPTATGNVISGTFIAAGGGFTVLVNNGTDDETWTVTIN